MRALSAILLMARREVRLLVRGRVMRGAVILLAAVAWLPMLLLPLRSGAVGVASFAEVIPLQIALVGVVLPLLALLAGSDLLAGELEDGTLVPALTLAISRRQCFSGKTLGRAGLLVAVYLSVFAAGGLAVALIRGAAGWEDWMAVGGAGLLLSLVSGSIGIAIGASGRGRVRAFGAALAAWVILVFALDAVLLSGVVALAPKPPAGVGEHGHSELSVEGRQAPIHDPHARRMEPQGQRPSELAGWLLALNPVSLFRLTALVASPGLRPRLVLSIPSGSPGSLWSIVVVGWLVWLVVPTVVGLARFQRADLT